MTSLLLALPAGKTMADVISLKTEKAVGTEISLALNAGCQAKLAWGNGTTEDVTFTEMPQTLTVKDAQLTITSEAAITTFYAPAAGISSLNVEAATGLQKLFCAGNELTELNLKKNTSLTDLDCQGNKLQALDVTKSTGLVHLNCAKNELTSLKYPSSSSALRTLVCSDNQLKTLSMTTSLTGLYTLWLDKNQLEEVKINGSKDLRTLNLSSNKLKKVTFAVMKQLSDLRLENNQLKELNISYRTPALRFFAIDHNNISNIKWDEDCTGTLERFYCNDNNLFFHQFPSSTKIKEGVYVPQAPFELVSENIPSGGQKSFADFAKNAHGQNVSLTITFTDAEGNSLVKKRNTGDYYNSGTTYTFYKMQPTAITATATSGRYDDAEILSLPFYIYDAATGIEKTTADELKFAVSKGLLLVTANADNTLRVYDATGRQIVCDKVSTGSHAYPLSSGIYVVNGKKVLVP